MPMFTRLFHLSQDQKQQQQFAIDIESQQIVKYESTYDDDDDEKKQDKHMITVYEKDDSLHLIIPHAVSSILRNGDVGNSQIIIETDSNIDNEQLQKRSNARLSLEILLDLLIILTMLLFLQLLYMGYKSGLFFKII